MNQLRLLPYRLGDLSESNTGLRSSAEVQPQRCQAMLLEELRERDELIAGLQAELRHARATHARQMARIRANIDTLASALAESVAPAGVAPRLKLIVGGVT